MTFLKKNRILFGGGIAFVIYLLIALWIITSQVANGQSSTWTVQTLKEYTDARFDALKEAIEKADAYTAYRDAKQNEFRGALDDANLKFALKESVDKEIQGIKDLIESHFNNNKARIEKLELEMQKITYLKTGQSNTIAWLIGGFGLIIAAIALGKNLIAFIFKPK